MELIKVCNKCGEVVKVNHTTIKTVDCYNDDKESYELMYVECNRCKEVIILQIDNDETKQLLQRIKTSIMSCIARDKNGRKQSKLSRKRIDESNAILDKMRKDIYAVNKGKTFYDINKNIIVKGLTIESESDIIESNL